MTQTSKLDNYHRVRTILATLIIIEFLHLGSIIYFHYKSKEHDAKEIMNFYADIFSKITYIFIFTVLYVLVGRII